MSFNIADIFESVARACADRPALACGDRVLTFRALDEEGDRLAAGLSTLGVGVGDHVGLQLYNSVEFVVAMLAVLKLRAVPINVNYRYVSTELAYLYEDANLMALLYEAELEPQVREAVSGRTSPRALVCVRAEPGVPVLGVRYDDVVATAASPATFGARSSDDLYIIYTGGTTGMPKGVMWRHEDIFFAGLQGGRAGGDPVSAPHEVAEHAAVEGNGLNIHPAAPLIHGAAQLATWICLNSGGTLVLVEGKSFRPEETARAIATHGVHVVNLVGDAMARPLAEVIASDPARYDASTLVALSSAGAILSDAVKTQLQEALPNAMILNNFGASETGHQGTAVDIGDGKLRFFMHGDATLVVDDDMKPVAPGETGWIARRGHVPLGYYRDEEKTAQTFATIEGSRYVIPGDRGVLDEDGTIVLLGRGSICINTGGEKVFPEEVEQALKGHAAVMDAIVVGLPDERWGQRVCALVQPRIGHEVDAETLGGFVRGRLAGYKVPRSWFFLASLNRQPSGKADYRWAREIAAELSAHAG